MEEINIQNSEKDKPQCSVQDNEQNRTIIIRQEAPKSNSVGMAGFVMAIVTLFLGWVPVLGWLLWVLGLVFSFAGLFKAPRGLAVAGFVISLFGLVFMLVIVAWLMQFVSMPVFPIM